MLAPVNKIIPLSVVDGPGNRSAIFLQDCNLTCAYCHNPETQRMCIHCGLCVEQCPVQALSVKEEGQVAWDDKICTLCDRCINVCPHYASPRIKSMSAEEVMNEVKKSIPFIRGITVSGGECTLHPEFLTELFILAKQENLTCLIDSNGTIDLSLYPKLIANCDGVMLDMKAWDPKLFHNLTGGDNAIGKKNLIYLLNENKLEEVRIVCLPEEVDATEIIRGIAKMVGARVGEIKLKLIRFRSFGVKGRLEHTISPEDAYMEELKNLALEIGFSNIVII